MAVRKPRNTSPIHAICFVSLWWCSNTSPVSAFVRPTSVRQRSVRQTIKYNSKVVQFRLRASVESSAEDHGKKFDDLLDDPTNKFGEAVQYLQLHPDIEISRDRFNRIFDAIEERTAAAEVRSVNTRMEQELPMLSRSRIEMTEMYGTLKKQGHLRLFAGINKDNMPASGSHSVRPNLMETITLLSMKSLTPKPTNTLLYAGMIVAFLESLASASLGWDLNVLFFVSITAALVDRVLLNGAISETLVKVISPETQPKITRHEAGHFLCAYLLGCPVEGYVLSAFSALKDPRFGPRGVSAGTSFFDQDLSSQMAKSKIKRSAIDRYSIIVMAGIAAEAINYGRADGGAGDELALIAFLSNLNGDSKGSNPAWNDLTIRNQARWGAVQAVLMLREYRECYDALVDAMERGASLADCIYAVENAGREYNKVPLEKPLGYIVEQPGGFEEVWVTDVDAVAALQQETMKVETSQPSSAESPDPKESLETLRSMVTSRISDLDEQLGKLNESN